MFNITKGYTAKLDYFSTQKAIGITKTKFTESLSDKLNLINVVAPTFLKTGTGLQDDLAGTQTPVKFKPSQLCDVELVHSLAKWKRCALGKYHFDTGAGLYADMNAIRKDEMPTEIHSVYVDQWDWELVITKNQRNKEFLEDTVKKIYSTIKDTEKHLNKIFPILDMRLPQKITFATTQEAENSYPTLSPKERENMIAKECGAVFLECIGKPLRSGKPHDLRAADYDDWNLNGDIIVWDHTREQSLELSSMGIRVDSESLIYQLEQSNLTHRKGLDFQRAIIDGTLPESIGGGIGQSRLCMLLLHKAHIGEVQASEWPDQMVQECLENGIELL